MFWTNDVIRRPRKFSLIRWRSMALKSPHYFMKRLQKNSDLSWKRRAPCSRNFVLCRFLFISTTLQSMTKLSTSSLMLRGHNLALNEPNSTFVPREGTGTLASGRKQGLYCENPCNPIQHFHPRMFLGLTFRCPKVIQLKPGGIVNWHSGGYRTTVCCKRFQLFFISLIYYELQPMLLPPLSVPLPSAGHINPLASQKTQSTMP